MEVRLQNPGEGPGGPGPPLFLDQNEARRTEKIFFEAGPAPLSEGLHDRPNPPPPPPYLKIWICHWTVISLHLRRRERELMLLKFCSIIFCTDLVIDIDMDLDREKVYFTTRYTGVATR